MIEKRTAESMHRGNHGWLKSIFHFSFADYYDPKNLHFGALRVMNDDLIAPNNGFDTHPHKDMEIVTYCLEGELTHEDNQGHKSTIRRGEFQYMNAGTGIFHSERNQSRSETARIIQTWILPKAHGTKPTYADLRYKKEDRHNTLLKAALPLQQDAAFYVSECDAGTALEFSAQKLCYVVCLEGQWSINSELMAKGDALKIKGPEELMIRAEKDAHLMLITL